MKRGACAVLLVVGFIFGSCNLVRNRARMDMSSPPVPELSDLSAVELSYYLTKIGVSSSAASRLVDNNVSGCALLLVDDEELKELLHTIGDRALVRDLLNRTVSLHSFFYPTLDLLSHRLFLLFSFFCFLFFYQIILLIIITLYGDDKHACIAIPIGQT